MPEMIPEPRQPVYLMLRMKPPWVFIDEIRRFVESFCACACAVAANRESQLALAVHELMQNAVPHSHDEEVDLVLEVDPDADRVRGRGDEPLHRGGVPVAEGARRADELRAGCARGTISPR